VVSKEQNGGQGEERGDGEHQRPEAAAEPPVLVDPEFAVKVCSGLGLVQVKGMGGEGGLRPRAMG
jgi:hypothetical protein